MPKNKLISAKNKIAQHKTKILVGALAVTTVYAAALNRNKTLFDNFLKEKDLYEEYYTPEDDI
jgi:uncharacterized protein YjfI (DUF2170 family)